MFRSLIAIFAIAGAAFYVLKTQANTESIYPTGPSYISASKYNDLIQEFPYACVARGLGRAGATPSGFGFVDLDSFDRTSPKCATFFHLKQDDNGTYISTVNSVTHNGVKYRVSSKERVSPNDNELFCSMGAASTIKLWNWSGHGRFEQRYSEVVSSTREHINKETCVRYDYSKRHNALILYMPTPSFMESSLPYHTEVVYLFENKPVIPSWISLKYHASRRDNANSNRSDTRIDNSDAIKGGAFDGQGDPGNPTCYTGAPSATCF